MRELQELKKDFKLREQEMERRHLLVSSQQQQDLISFV
jgi:hypothetical protein